MSIISFVIPCYRSEKTIKMVVDEIIETVAQMDGFDYEIIAVNDFSPDNVYGVLKTLAADNDKIKVINLARNIGKHRAIMAGYSVAKGDYIVNLDDDFQCPVYELQRMMAPILEDEADVTVANYEVKMESKSKRLGSSFNLLISEIMLDKPKGLKFENFSVMRRFVMEEVIKYHNPYPYLEGLILRATQRVVTVELKERERGDNNGSGFTLRRSIDLFLNGLTSFSVKPLQIASIIGVIFAVIGFIYGIIVVLRKIFIPGVMVGYSSLMATLLLTSGLIMFMLGIVGEYVGRIFISLNSSPQYVIRDTINVEGK